MKHSQIVGGIGWLSIFVGAVEADIPNNHGKKDQAAWH